MDGTIAMIAFLISSLSFVLAELIESRGLLSGVVVLAISGLILLVFRKSIGVSWRNNSNHMPLRVTYEELETVGFDSGGGEMLNYKNQPFTGFIVQYDEATRKLLCEEEFTQGHLGGAQRTFHENGQIKTESFVKFNRYYGLAREWDENGSLIKTYDWGDESKLITTQS